MQRYFNYIQDKYGNSVVGASVVVTGGTIYSDEGVTPVPANTLTTNYLGFFSFYAANGKYDLQISGAGISGYTIRDVELSDALDAISTTDLTDMPGSLVANKWPKVNSGGTAYELVDNPAGALASTNLSDMPARVALKLLRVNATGTAYELMTNDADNINHTSTGTGAVARTVGGRLSDKLSVFDFMTPAEIADVTAYTKLVDVRSALQSAINAAEAEKQPLYLPRGAYLISAGFTQIDYSKISIYGDGSYRSFIVCAPTMTGAVLDFSECWSQSAALPGNTTLDTNITTAVNLQAFSIVGDRTVVGNQHGILFQDRCDDIYLRDVQLAYLKGYGLSFGKLDNTAFGYTRESAFHNIRVHGCGAAGYPAVDITSEGAGDSTNELYFNDLKIIFPFGKGLHIRNSNTVKRTTLIKIDGFQLHGIQVPSPAITEDLMVIDNLVSNVEIDKFSANASYAGYAAIKITGANITDAPYTVSIKGAIGAGAGNGVNVEYGRELLLDLIDNNVTGTELIVGANAGSCIIVDNGNYQNWVKSINSAAAGNVHIDRPNFMRRVVKSAVGSPFALTLSNNTVIADPDNAALILSLPDTTGMDRYEVSIKNIDESGTFALSIDPGTKKIEQPAGVPSTTDIVLAALGKINLVYDEANTTWWIV